MPIFRDSVSRLVTGDVAPDLGLQIHLESAVASPALLERRGSHSEGLAFAPLTRYDEIPNLSNGDTATIVIQVFTPLEGTLTIEQEVIQAADATYPLLSEEPTSAPVAEAADPLLAALIAGVEAGTVVFDPVTGLFHPASIPAQESAPPPPPVEATAPAAPEVPAINPIGQQSVEELPAGGCETVVDVAWDESLQDYEPATYHFNGVSYDRIG